jgi:hypothetical protein
MLQLLVKVGTNINVLSQHGYIVVSNISIILGIANVFKYFIELRAHTPLIIRVLAHIHCLRKN